jgi:cell division protein FtsN
MGSEFQAPHTQESSIREFTNVNLGHTDRIIGGVLVAVLIALILWVGSATQSAQVEIAKLSAQLESLSRDRDLSLIYIEKRLEKLEIALDNLKDDNTKN